MVRNKKERCTPTHPTNYSGSQTYLTYRPLFRKNIIQRPLNDFSKLGRAHTGRVFVRISQRTYSYIYVRPIPTLVNKWLLAHCTRKNCTYTYVIIRRPTRSQHVGNFYFIRAYIFFFQLATDFVQLENESSWTENSELYPRK